MIEADAASRAPMEHYRQASQPLMRRNKRIFAGYLLNEGPDVTVTAVRNGSWSKLRTEGFSREAAPLKPTALGRIDRTHRSYPLA